MKKVEIYLGANHPFLEDYDDKLEKNLNIYRHWPTREENEQYIKEWYGYDVEIDSFGLNATLTMTEQQHTLFMLRWAQ